MYTAIHRSKLFSNRKLYGTDVYRARLALCTNNGFIALDIVSTTCRRRASFSFI